MNRLPVCVGIVVFVSLAVLVTPPARAASPPAAAAATVRTTHEFPNPGRPRLTRGQRINLAWQIALAANNFSPGILDGVFGPNSRMALREYGASNFPGDNPFNPHDPRIYDALDVDVRHVFATYTISPQDAQAVGHLHYHWRGMAAATRMPYASLAGCLCEKFHCTRALLQRLNPRLELGELRVGQTINVPNIRPFPGPNDFGLPGGLSTVLAQDKEDMPDPPVAYLVINLKQKVIRAYNRHNRQVALFHCSIPAHPAEFPTRDARIKDIAENPNYTFLPSMYPHAHSKHILIIPPGPRNPVGVVWMGLTLPGVGLHGNPVPQYIGLTGSHGCFRLTNWDAARLFTLVHIGMPVIIVNPAHPIPLTLHLPAYIDPPGVVINKPRSTTSGVMRRAGTGG